MHTAQGVRFSRSSLSYCMCVCARSGMCADCLQAWWLPTLSSPSQFLIRILLHMFCIWDKGWAYLSTVQLHVCVQDYKTRGQTTRAREKIGWGRNSIIKPKLESDVSRRQKQGSQSRMRWERVEGGHSPFSAILPAFLSFLSLQLLRVYLCVTVTSRH